MKKLVLLLVVTSFALGAYAQKITDPEPASGHYKRLQSLSALSTGNKELDTILFPVESASSGGLIYTLSKPGYLTEENVLQLVKSLQYPSNSSDQTRAEIEYLLELQEKRTPEIEKRVLFLGDLSYWPHLDQENNPASTENSRDLYFIAREVISPDFNPELYKATDKLFRTVMKDMRLMEFMVKYRYMRPRPYQVDKRIKPLAQMQSPAFVSGHTLWAYIHAYLWSEIIPEKREGFLKIAEELRQSREIMGIHFPSDNENARLLAHRILVAATENAQFNKDLQEAKNEFRSQVLKK
jgi:acid phosphatase (class A)